MSKSDLTHEAKQEKLARMKKYHVRLDELRSERDAKLTYINNELLALKDEVWAGYREARDKLKKENGLM